MAHQPGSAASNALGLRNLCAACGTRGGARRRRQPGTGRWAARADAARHRTAAAERRGAQRRIACAPGKARLLGLPVAGVGRVFPEVHLRRAVVVCVRTQSAVPRRRSLNKRTSRKAPALRCAALRERAVRARRQPLHKLRAAENARHGKSLGAKLSVLSRTGPSIARDAF